VPVCFRHPDRETYIRCTRCERSICPDCMISASVGFQCPECVAEGKASAPVIKTRLGAKAPTRPYVTFAIIGLCVAVFAYQSLGGDKVDNDFAMSPVYVAANNEYYRLVTSMFMHVNLLHIGMNMLVLWLLGPQLEFMLGHVRYAVLYLVAGIGGSVASFWLSSPYEISGQFYLPSSSVGASGAIFGLMGAYLVVGRALKADVSQALGLIVINLVLGFVIPNTDWRAHLGGLVTGILVAIPMAYAPKRGRTAIQVGAVVVVLSLLAGAVVLRDQALTEQMIRDRITVSAVGA
jgi:membrane associated rhomboid family serine protease